MLTNTVLQAELSSMPEETSYNYAFTKQSICSPLLYMLLQETCVQLASI